MNGLNRLVQNLIHREAKKGISLKKKKTAARFSLETRTHTKKSINANELIAEDTWITVYPVRNVQSVTCRAHGGMKEVT